MLRIGVISDTHGLLRPQALEAMQGSDFIVHAGDIGNQDILDQLAAIAPVTAVRGNNDRGAWAAQIPDAARLDLGETGMYVIHDKASLDIDPVASGVRIVVTGHTHRPTAQWHGGILYLNPGSAGPRRFKLPVAVAELLVDGPSVTVRVIELTV
jgi:putative phosphoesterase